jgi:signal transduction histidine kinase
MPEVSANQRGRPAPGSVSRRVGAGFSLLVLLFLAVVTVPLIAGDRLQDGRRRTGDRLDAVRAANEAVLQNMTDAETSVRGFQLTGRRDFLEPYDSGRVGAFTALTAAEAGTRDPAVTRLLDAERLAAAHWLSAYAVPTVLGGVADDDESRMDRGRQMFDAVRTSNAAAGRAVAAEGKAAAAGAERTYRLATLLFAVLDLLFIALALLLFALGRRQLLAPLEQRLQHRQSRLIGEQRALDDRKDAFVATVTHELRTPLTSILGYTEMLADGDGGELSALQQRGVAAILRNALRLQETVADLLLLDRTTSRLGASHPPVDLTGITAAAVAELTAPAAGKDLVLTLHCAGPAWVRGDEDQLRRAVHNLLDNAIKFTAPGGRIVCRIGVRDGAAAVTVTDTGIGIPPDDLAGLGTPFHRAANAMDQAVQGSGLGLAIVYTIVAEHGGTIEAQSQVDTGSTFTMTLPVVADPARATAVALPA